MSGRVHCERWKEHLIMAILIKVIGTVYSTNGIIEDDGGTASSTMI